MWKCNLYRQSWLKQAPLNPQFSNVLKFPWFFLYAEMSLCSVHIGLIPKMLADSSGLLSSGLFLLSYVHLKRVRLPEARQEVHDLSVTSLRCIYMVTQNVQSLRNIYIELLRSGPARLIRPLNIYCTCLHAFMRVIGHYSLIFSLYFTNNLRLPIR